MRTAKSKRADWTLCSIGLAALLFECQAATAEPLDLDLTCNGTGKVTTSITNDPQSVMELARGVAIQQDGKIIATGWAYSGDQNGNDFVLVRYKPDCSLDQMFGTNGRVLTDFNSTDDYANAVVIQPDGKIVVAGTVELDFALARYMPDGTLDQSFGTGGLARVDFGQFEDARGVALQSDGKIVIAGQQYSDSSSNFLTARYLPDGALDSSFGDAGKVITDFGDWDMAWAMAIQGDGKIVAAGSSWDSDDFLPTYGAMVRYNPNGTLDTSFDRGAGPVCMAQQSCGKFRVNLGLEFYDYPVSVALRAADGTEDGKILVAGAFGMARFKANGSLDQDFGSAGIMDQADNTGDALAILGNDHIVVAGQASGDFGVAIYGPSGKLCSGDASVATDFNGHGDLAMAMAIQSDGKIVVAGMADNSANTDWNFALARYEGGDCPIRLPKLLGHYVAYNFFVHPQDMVGPPVDPSGPFRELQIGRSEHLALPASEGGTFVDQQLPGYQSFKLTSANEQQLPQNASAITVTDVHGASMMERREAQKLLVPTDMAAGRAGGVPVSGSRSVPVMKCYRVTMPRGSDAPRERKTFVVTDALKRSWTIEVGEPETLCKAIDRRGRELTGRAPSLLGYQVRAIKGAAARPVRLPAANEFGVRIFHVGQPELLFVPALAE